MIIDIYNPWFYAGMLMGAVFGMLIWPRLIYWWFNR